MNPYAEMLHNLSADVLKQFADCGFTLSYWHRPEPGGAMERIERHYSAQDVRTALDDVKGDIQGVNLSPGRPQVVALHGRRYMAMPEVVDRVGLSKLPERYGPVRKGRKGKVRRW